VEGGSSLHQGEQDLPDDLCGEEGGTAGRVEIGRKFNDIAGDYALPGNDLQEAFEGPPVNAAGFGSSRSGQESGVKEIEVEGDVQRSTAERAQGREEAGGIRGDEKSRVAEFGKFLGRAGADAALEESLPWKQVENTTHRTGVAPTATRPLLPEVGVGIQLDNGEIRMVMECGTYCARGKGVFTSQQDGNCALGKKMAAGIPHVLANLFGIVAPESKIAEISEHDRMEVSIEKRRV